MHSESRANDGAHRGVLGQYFDFLKRTLSSYPSGGTELGEKLKTYAKKTSPQRTNTLTN